MCDDPNCLFCEPCVCGHKSDEHIAGDGSCYRCECGKFTHDYNKQPKLPDGVLATDEPYSNR